MKKKKDTYALVARIKVRSYELDSYGHVNNAVYLHYLEYARGEFLTQKGMSLAHCKVWNAYPRVVRVGIDYKSPAFMGDTLRIEGAIDDWKRARFTLHYDIYNETTGTPCAVAETVMAFVNGTGRPVAIPEEFRRAFAVEKEDI